MVFIRIMKINNQEIINVFRCIQEVLHSQKAKEAIPDSGKIIYALMKSYNELDPIIKDLVGKETKLKEAAEASFTDLNKEEKIKILNKDLDSLYKEEQDVRLHQMSLENFEIVQKYISGPSTIALFNHLTRQNIDVVKKIPIAKESNETN